MEAVLGAYIPGVVYRQCIAAQMSRYRNSFVGAEGRMEMERVPAAGYRIIGLAGMWF